MLLNWVLGFVAIALWAFALVWLFWGDLRRGWRNRRDRWFRPD